MAGPSRAKGQAEELGQADASSRPIATPQRLVRCNSPSTRRDDGTASPDLAQLARRSRELQADFHSIPAEEPPSPPQQSRSRSHGRGQDPSESLVALATPQRRRTRLTPRKQVPAATPRSSGAPAPGSVRDTVRRASEAPRLQSSRSQRAPATPGTPLTPAMHRLLGSTERTSHSSAPLPSPSVSSTYRSAKRARFAPPEAQALQEENERLRRENSKLRVVQADREEMKAAFEEIDKLRRQNLELAKGNGKAAADLGEQRSFAIDRGARGNGTQFNPHLWEKERQSQKGAPEPDAGVIAIVPTEPMASQSQTQTIGKEVPAEPAVPVAVGAPLDSAVQPWIFHASLASASEQSLGSQLTIPPLLQCLRADVACGTQDGLAGKLTDVFREHLEDADRPYLAFSALIPSLFGMLCLANQLASGLSGCRYAQCAALIRHLMNTSRFGEKLPKKKPEDMTRHAFVRELCAQAGLSLDLARLGLAHRKELSSVRAASQPAVESVTPARNALQLGLQDTPAEASSIQKESPLAALESGAHTPQDADENVLDSQISQSNASNAGSTSASSSQLCVDKVEVKGALARAGRYLAAVQMDMERLHDEHNSRRRAAMTAASKAEPVAETQESAQPKSPQESLPEPQDPTAANLAITDGTEQLEAETAADLLAHDLDDEASIPSLPLDFPSVSAEQVRSLLAAASSELPLEESAVAGTAPSAASQSTASMLADLAVLDDPLVMPPLGKFLTDQLLPLYVGDIPFETLKNLIDRYCGVPIDSDDEARAWKVWGRPCPKRKPRETRPDTRKRQPSRENSTGDKPSVPSTPSGTAATEGAETQETGDPSSSPHQDLSHLPEAVRSLKRRASAESVPFSQLRQVIEGATTMGPPTMRTMMLTSTIEKRRTDHAAPANMTGSSRPSRLRSNSSNTLTSRDPTPAVKPSLALLNFRTPGKDALGTPASQRKAAWRQLNESAAATSTRKPRTEGVLNVRGSPAPAAPNWTLLDTPCRPRPPDEQATPAESEA